MVFLCTCWAHIRRNYIKCAASHEDLASWRDRRIVRIAGIYRLNRVRLEHWVPDSDTRTPAFERAQAALKTALDEPFAQAERERAALPEDARQMQPLRSMIEHREGLTLFLEHPQTSMDTSRAELAHRSGVIARKLSFGSDSLNGARLTAVMSSVLGTLDKNGLDVQRSLTACAGNGRSPPGDPDAWLPWTMSEERRRAWTRAS